MAYGIALVEVVSGRLKHYALYFSRCPQIFMHCEYGYGTTYNVMPYNITTTSSLCAGALMVMSCRHDVIDKNFFQHVSPGHSKDKVT